MFLALVCSVNMLSASISHVYVGIALSTNEVSSFARFCVRALVRAPVAQARRHIGDIRGQRHLRADWGGGVPRRHGAHDNLSYGVFVFVFLSWCVFVRKQEARFSKEVIVSLTSTRLDGAFLRLIAYEATFCWGLQSPITPARFCYKPV